MFYVGQQVIITNRQCGHGIEIGSVVRLEKAERGVHIWHLEYDGWAFDEDDCEPYNVTLFEEFSAEDIANDIAKRKRVEEKCSKI